MKLIAMTRIVALALVLTLLGHSGAARAESASPVGGGEHVSYTVGSALGTVLYTPWKALLCVTGGMASGLVFLSSGPEAAKAVASAACKGSWVVTPDILRGEQPFDVVGDFNLRPEDPSGRSHSPLSR